MHSWCKHCPAVQPRACDLHVPCDPGAQIAQKYNLVIVEDDAYWWLQYGNEEAEPDEMAHSNGRAKARIKMRLGHAGGKGMRGGKARGTGMQWGHAHQRGVGIRILVAAVRRWGSGAEQNGTQ